MSGSPPNSSTNSGNNTTTDNNTDNNSGNNTTNNTTTNTTTDNNSSNNTTTNTTTDNNSGNNSGNNTTTNTTNTNNTQPNVLLNQTIVEPGLQVNYTQDIIPGTSVTTNATFTSTDPANHVPNISENLNEIVEYNYDDNIITESDNLVNEIRDYATKIKCEDFHGKGTIDDYAVLFQAASKIANDSKQMQLDIDIDGFNDFGKAADDLSALFINFTKRLQNINIINDSSFLKAVLDSLKKIYNLSEVFGKFKSTILVTSEIKIPKTAHDTKIILAGVMDEVNCAMNYINNFVTPDPALTNAHLTAADKNIITKAVDTIDNWQTLCDQGVSIALTNNSDMVYLKQTNQELKQKTVAIKSMTDKLKLKLTQYNWNV